MSEQKTGEPQELTSDMTAMGMLFTLVRNFQKQYKTKPDQIAVTEPLYKLLIEEGMKNSRFAGVQILIVPRAQVMEN